AQRLRELHAVHQGEAQDEDGGGHDEAADHLGPQLVHTTTPEEPGDDGGRVLSRRPGDAELTGGEEPQAEGAPDAADAVDRYRIELVVDPDPIQEVHTQHHDDAGDGADDD